MACQHPDGGFGGGPGQAAQLLPSYAAVCTLAIVGRPGPRGGWDQIDRWAPNCVYGCSSERWVLQGEVVQILYVS
jgi:prenyltransferase beta subunit